MKHRTNYTDIYWFIGVVAAVFLTFFLLYQTSRGATRYDVYRLSAGGEIDTVMIYWNVMHGGASQIVKGDTVTTFTGWDSVSLSDTTNYKVIRLWHFTDDADGIYWGDDYVLPFRTGDTIQRAASTLISSDNIGVNFSDIAGTIDAVEINNNVFSRIGQETADSVGAGITATVSDADKQEIAALVDDTLTTNHGSGSWQTGGTGSGLYLDSLVFYDSAYNAMIPYVTYDVADGATGASQAKAGTGSDGIGAFSADAGTYRVISASAGYTIATDYVATAADQTDTIFGYRYVPSAPSADNVCIVYGWARFGNGVVDDAAKVVFSPTSSEAYNRCDTTFISPKGLPQNTDANGYFQKELYYSYCMTTTGSDSLQWNVSIQYSDGSTKLFQIWVPQQESYKIVP